MFPWSQLFSGNALSDDHSWQAFNQVLSLVNTIISWDVIKGTLVFLFALSLITYLVGRIRNLAGTV